MRVLLFAVLFLAACHVAERPLATRAAEVHIVVDDTVATLDSVIATVEASGGRVVRTHVRREGDTLRASVILQVPQQELMRTLATIRGEAVVLEREMVMECRPLAGGTPSSKR